MHSDGFILVAFGNFPLTKLIQGMEDEAEIADFLLMAPTKLTPRYKKQMMCSVEEVEAAVKYTEWLKETVSSYEDEVNASSI